MDHRDDDNRETHQSEAAELDVIGLMRRVRRVLGIGQRELAVRLGVSAALVGAWETGVREPSLTVFRRLMGLAGMRISVVDPAGEPVQPMEADEVRDRGGRRFPSHLDTVPVFDEDALRAKDPRPRVAAAVGRGPTWEFWKSYGVYELRPELRRHRNRWISQQVSAEESAAGQGRWRAETLARWEAWREELRRRAWESSRERRRAESVLCFCPVECEEGAECVAECGCRCESPDRLAVGR